MGDPAQRESQGGSSKVSPRVDSQGPAVRRENGCAEKHKPKQLVKKAKNALCRRGKGIAPRVQVEQEMSPRMKTKT